MTILHSLTIEQLRHIADLAAAARANSWPLAAASSGLAEAAGTYTPESGLAHTAALLSTMRQQIASLNAAARAELIAIAQIGRHGLGEGGLLEWQARAAAMDDEDVTDVLARASLGHDLDTGAERLGLRL